MDDYDLSEHEITNLATLERAIREVGIMWRGIDCLWRGHAVFEWCLKADVFRPKPDGQEHSENSLIRYFMAYGGTRHVRCPDHDDFLGWLTLARHYGLPTRLLDWSTSPLVALFFAVSEDEGNATADGCLWALSPGNMNGDMIGGSSRLLAPDSPEIQSVIRAAFEVDHDRRIERMEAHPGLALAFGPREIDARMLAQQGQFTVHADSADLANKAYGGSGTGTTYGPWRRAFCVPNSAKVVLRDLLRAAGIRRYTLFPDLHSLAHELRSRNILG